MVAAKAIFCIWTGIFMVLPGCLCQVLEPLGVHVPHHRHGGVDCIAMPSGKPCAIIPRGIPEPTVPCHCDERPDRTSDECVALIAESEEPDAQIFSHATTAPDAQPPYSANVRVTWGRGPPAYFSATSRSFLCIYLV